jgi:hypothetical protein
MKQNQIRIYIGAIVTLLLLNWIVCFIAYRACVQIAEVARSDFQKAEALLKQVDSKLAELK